MKIRGRIERLENQAQAKPQDLQVVLMLPTVEPGIACVLRENGQNRPLTQAERDAWCAAHPNVITVKPKPAD